MPSDSPRNAIDRQWHLLDLLPSTPPGKTTTELVDALAESGFDVTKRTVERDLVALSSRFPITSTDEKPCGWYWRSRKALGILGLSVTDAFTLQMLERYLRPLLPVATTRQLEPLFELAKNKLEAEADSNEIARWASMVTVEGSGLPTIPPSINPAILQTVQEAMLKGEKLKIRHLKTGTDTSREHTISPVGLVQSGEKTYLIASKPGKAKPASFALHRIDHAERTHERAELPKGVSLKSYIQDGDSQFFNKGLVKLKAWVSSELGSQLDETRLSEKQKLTPKDNGFILTVELPDSLRLRQWILSWTSHIQVLEPKALRSDIADKLSSGLAQYK
ncbi:WYL domain-containing protein [Betaproteobacteria bacterium SCN2]|nr:WYL domain-containing protein [Betaproteobacteria bacterium SCN2]